MMVLGLDPGFAAFGVAAVEVERNDSLNPMRGWVLRTERSARKLAVRASEDNVRRAQAIAEALSAIVDEWRPQVLCAETMSWPRNAGAVAKVALAWGAVCALAWSRGLPLVQASPQEVKIAVSGRKNASKDEVIRYVESRFSGFDLPKQLTLQEHVADAIAVVVACRGSPVMLAAQRSINGALR